MEGLETCTEKGDSEGTAVPAGYPPQAIWINRLGDFPAGRIQPFLPAPRHSHYDFVSRGQYRICRTVHRGLSDPPGKAGLKGDGASHGADLWPAPIEKRNLLLCHHTADRRSSHRPVDGQEKQPIPQRGYACYF